MHDKKSIDNLIEEIAPKYDTQGVAQNPAHQNPSHSGLHYAVKTAATALAGVMLYGAIYTHSPATAIAQTSTPKTTQTTTYQNTNVQTAQAGQAHVQSAQPQHPKEFYDALAKKAYELIDAKKYSETIKILQPYAEDDYNNSYGFYNELGYAHLKAGDNASAALFAEKALKIDPLGTDATRNLFNAYRHLGRYEDAKNLLLKYIQAGGQDESGARKALDGMRAKGQID